MDMSDKFIDECTGNTYNASTIVEEYLDSHINVHNAKDIVHQAIDYLSSEEKKELLKEKYDIVDIVDYFCDNELYGYMDLQQIYDMIKYEDRIDFMYHYYEIVTTNGLEFLANTEFLNNDHIKENIIDCLNSKRKKELFEKIGVIEKDKVILHDV